MKTALITGGSGFLGRHLAQRMKESYRVVLASRDHSLNQAAEKETGCLVVPLDVSSAVSVEDVFSEFHPEVVVHAAAAKFVDVSEKNPMECVDTNIMGSQNVIRASVYHEVETLVGISTDKAASPGNIYGLSKSVMERMFHLMSPKSETKMVCVRFGNIAWATGSVLTIWRNIFQTRTTIGATDMRRFFFTVEQANELVMNAINWTDTLGLNGKVLVRAMKVAAISELAEAWVNVHGGAWDSIAGRPGDKLHEELISAAECPHTTPLAIGDDEHYMIDFSRPSLAPLREPVTTENSEKLSTEELRSLILSERW